MTEAMVNSIIRRVKKYNSIEDLENTVERAINNGLFYSRQGQYDKSTQQYKIAHSALDRLTELTEGV